jgi:Ca2+-binding RTX toxin-like protein
MYKSGVGVTASHEWYADGIQGYNSGVQAINANGTMVAEGVSLAVYNGSLQLITKLSERYPEFAGAAGLAFSPDGSKLYLLDRNSKEVFVLDTSSWDVLGGYPVGADVTTGAVRYGNALQVSADGAQLAVIGTVSLQVIDLRVAISDAGTSAGDDNLSGDGGRDYLFGFGGNDVIDGGLSGDVMYGGSGNDTYYVESSDDQVIEGFGGGADTIYSSIDFFLPSEVETLVLTGTARFGYGTWSADTIIANDLANELYGEAGDDLLRGGAGNDWIVGGTGNDRMEGGAGDDTYFVDSPADVVIEDALNGTDEIVATFTYALPDNVE